jgi:hypothetical protein
VFVRSGGVWSQHQKLTAGDAAQGDEFGTAVALDVDRPVVGAHYKESSVGDLAGAVYVFGPNTPPVCVVKIEPVECGTVFPSGSTLYAIAVEEEVCLTLDGSDSSDVNDDPLTISWVIDSGSPISGAAVTECLELGCHTITMIVSDGLETCQESRDLCVITAGEAVQQCIDLLQNTPLAGKSKRPLITSLKSAANGLDHGSLTSGYNQLQAFQKKVEAQISKDHPVEAQAFSDCVNHVLAALECVVTLNHGNGILN